MQIGSSLSVAVLVGTVATGAVSAHAQVPDVAPKAPGTALIVGRVVDAVSGAPVAGALVGVRRIVPDDASGPPAAPPDVWTTSDGYFYFRDLAAGSYRVQAAKGGFLRGQAGQRRPSGDLQPITLTDGARITLPAIALWPSGGIAGTILDDTGEPRANTLVEAWRRERRAGAQRFVFASRASTDERGLYRLASLAPGDYLVSVEGGHPADFPTVADAIPDPTRLPDRRPTIFPRTFSPDAREADLASIVSVGPGAIVPGVDIRTSAVPAYRLAGHLENAGDAPVSFVALAPDGSRTLDEVRRVATAEPVGNDFVFEAVPAGAYRLLAVTEWITDRDDVSYQRRGGTPIIVADRDLDDVVLRLDPGHVLAGRVRFEGPSSALPQPSSDGSRIEVVATALDPETSTFEQRTAYVGDDLVFTMFVPNGQYAIHATITGSTWSFRGTDHDGVDVSDQALTLADADVTDLTVTFTRASTGLSGTTRTSRGDLDPDAIVLTFPTDAGGWQGPGYTFRRTREQRVTSSGTWDVADLPPGDYYVVAIPDVSADGWTDPASLTALASIATRVTVEEGRRTHVELRTRERR